MNVCISEQAAALGLSALLGAALGLIYDILRLARRGARRVHASAVLTALCDLLFWLVSAASIFLFAMTVTGGVLRLYAIFGTAAGMTLWFLTLSPALLHVGDAIIAAAAAALRFIFTPLRLLCKFSGDCTKKLLRFIKKPFNNRK